MTDETRPRTPTGSTIRVRIEVQDQAEGSFSTVDVALAEVAEQVMQADTGDRYEPVLPAIEAVARECVNKVLAQVCAYESVAAARDGAVAP